MTQIPMAIAIQLGACSVCGKQPALCVDGHHKGTYWLCGDCMEEEIVEKIRWQEAIADFAERVGYEHKIWRDERDTS